jgi:hypothetical protein
MRNSLRMKSNPFASLRTGKVRPHNVSLDRPDPPNPAFHHPSDQNMQPKSRNKSFVRAKESSNLDIAVNLSFKDLGKELKSKRTLVEENEDLKKKLETLMHNKSSRRGSTAKKMSTEFEKEIYWNGTQSYMISGIKLQYQKMKDCNLSPLLSLPQEERGLRGPAAFGSSGQQHGVLSLYRGLVGGEPHPGQAVGEI